MSHKLIIVILACGLFVSIFGCVSNDKGAAMSDSEVAGITEKLIAMENAALVRWGNGDPDGFLEIIADDYTYFDPFRNARVYGYDSIKALYDGMRGQVSYDRFELTDPKVQVSRDMAVLTFNFQSFSEKEDGTVEGGWRWHTTEVYRRNGDDWKLISTHWSFTNAELKELCRKGVFEDPATEG